MSFRQKGRFLLSSSFCPRKRAIFFWLVTKKPGSTFASHCSREITHLNSLLSSIIWTPWSYCSLVADSPMEAKWPFITIEGADGLVLTDGRRPPLTCRWDDDDAMVDREEEREKWKYQWQGVGGVGGFVFRIPGRGQGGCTRGNGRLRCRVNRGSE